MDIRTVPSQNAPDFVESSHSASPADPAPGLEVSAGQAAPLQTDAAPSGDREAAVLGAKCVGAPWFCDAAVFARQGVPSIALGPGSIAQAHTEDEWIDIAEFERGVRFFRGLFLRRLKAHGAAPVERALVGSGPQPYLPHPFSFQPMSAQKTAITPRRDEDFPEWYQQVVRAADLAENSDVRGCMVIKPWGYAHLGEHAARARRHVQGDRARERVLPAVHPAELIWRRKPSTSRASRRNARWSRITGSKPAPKAGCVPRRGELEEPLVVRPTRETIIGATLREVGAELSRPADPDQPMGERRALGAAARACSCARRSSSGRKGHTAHETRRRRAKRRCRCSTSTQTFASDYLALPVIHGREEAGERFPARSDALHRGDGAGSQGDPGRHLALPRAELRQGQRHQVPRARTSRSTPGRRAGA